jgi:DNA-binding MarR family transcriptional regulator
LKPGISNAALARAAFITSQTMHSIVSSLEKRGLVERKTDASHGRILCTELTERGGSVVVLAHDVIRDCKAGMLTNISEEHRILLEKLLLECFNNWGCGLKKCDSIYRQNYEVINGADHLYRNKVGQLRVVVDRCIKKDMEENEKIYKIVDENLIIK